MRVVRKSRPGALFLGLVLVSLAMSSGCSGDQQKTGTLVEKPPGSEAGEKASIDAMKAMMKTGQIKGVDRTK